MVAGKRDVVGVAFEGSNQALCRVIPDLDRPVVTSGEEVWLVGMGVVVNPVHTLRLVTGCQNLLVNFVSGAMASCSTYASNVKLAVEDPKDQIFTVLSRHAEANARERASQPADQ